MSKDNLDDWLDDLLAEEVYLEDNGFTDAVMARLPKANMSERRVKLCNWLAGCVASVFVAAFFPWGKTATVITGLNSEAWLIAVSVIGVVFTVISVTAGIWSERAAV